MLLFESLIFNCKGIIIYIKYGQNNKTNNKNGINCDTLSDGLENHIHISILSIKNR